MKMTRSMISPNWKAITASGAFALCLAITGCDRAPEATSPATGAGEGQAGIEPTAKLSAEPAHLETRQMDPYGRYLTDTNGRALYMFMADTRNPSQSNCDDACVQDWPPFTADDETIKGPDINPSLVGRIERPTGGIQVTYNGWPLYYYRVDSSGNTVQGQDLMSHGAEWYLVSPEGEPIRVEKQESNPSDSSVSSGQS